jgi:hypothetical protein
MTDAVDAKSGVRARRAVVESMQGFCGNVLPSFGPCGLMAGFHDGEDGLLTLLRCGSALVQRFDCCCCYVQAGGQVSAASTCCPRRFLDAHAVVHPAVQIVAETALEISAQYSDGVCAYLSLCNELLIVGTAALPSSPR